MASPVNSLAKAVALHEEHMRDPKTATPGSQKRLMNLLYRHKVEMGDKTAALLADPQRRPSLRLQDRLGGKSAWLPRRRPSAGLAARLAAFGTPSGSPAAFKGFTRKPGVLPGLSSWS